MNSNNKSSKAAVVTLRKVAPVASFTSFVQQLMAAAAFTNSSRYKFGRARKHMSKDEYADVSTYKLIFNLLVNSKQDEFFSEFWEKHPVVYQRGCQMKGMKGMKKEDSKAEAAALKALETLFSANVAKENADNDKNCLISGRDFKEVKYTEQHKRLDRVDFKEEEEEEEEDDDDDDDDDDESSSEDNIYEKSRIDGKYVEKSFNEGFTMQFFQPQRYSHYLSALNLAFEHTFGSLAGASAYLTPPRTQGLAPHYDDVEVFIFQTEGSKTWRLWKGPELPETSSKDISRGDLPDTYEEFVLYPGDMLYMPRGTIHEAVSNESFSTHVTFSVYQKYNNKAIICQLLPSLMDEEFAKNLSLKKGLPINMSEKLGTFVGLSLSTLDHSSSGGGRGGKKRDNNSVNSNIISCKNDTNEKEALKTWRHNYCESLKASLRDLSNSLTLDMIDKAADFINVDFMKFRLPVPKQISNSFLKEEEENDDDDDDHNNNNDDDDDDDDVKDDLNFVRTCDPRIYFCSVTEVDGVTVLTFQNSTFNRRQNHMGHVEPDLEEEIHSMLPIRLYPLVVLLQDCYRSQAGSDDEATRGAVSIDELEDRLRIHNIDRDEIVDALMQLEESSFVEFLRDYKDISKSSSGGCAKSSSSSSSSSSKVKSRKFHEVREESAQEASGSSSKKRREK